MRSSFAARHRVGIASALVVPAAVAALVAYVLAVPGFKARHANLDDGGVWITRDAANGGFGRLNNPVRQLDGVVYPTSSEHSSFDFDVLQDGSAVLGRDIELNQAYPIDPSGLAAVNAGKLAVSSADTLAMSGGTLALLDSARGAVRAVSYDPNAPLGDVGGLANGKPLATLGSGAALTVSTDGTIFAVSATTGRLTTIRPTASGFGRPSTTKLGTLSGTLRITAVGDQPVVFENATNQTTTTALLPDGKHVEIPNGSTAAIQQAGEAADAVLVATRTSLLSVSLESGAVTTNFNDANGTPAAPIRRQGCDYAAWAGEPARYGTTCFASKDTQILGNSPGPLSFRLNRKQVVLNDLTTGQTWNLESATPQQVANWDQVRPPIQKPNKQTKNNTNNTNQIKALPPKAMPDDFGARPGRTTALYVLDNDSDPAGETLAVESVKASAPLRQSQLSIAPDGQSVDISLPATQTAILTFNYVVKAAKGGPASAQVTVRPRPYSGTNIAPTLREKVTKTPGITVPEGGTVTVPVLADWRDYKDGDPVVLKGATAPTNGGRVTGTPDGDLVYTAPAQAGTRAISYTVSDTQGAQARGVQQVTVQAPDAQPVAATARPDYARGRVGVPITVSPLDNDLPGSDPLHPTATMKLAGKVAQPLGYHVNTDLDGGIVTLTASKPGPVTLTYQVGYGGAPLATGTIRIDVDPASASALPITAPDVAVLHGSESVTVDVLANDSDPAGNLLVVQRAVPSTDQLRVAVIDGRYLRIAPTSSAVTGPQKITYTVSDGVSASVDGQVTVTQLPAGTDDTPVTLDDYATVRGGETVAIPVLDNDVSPSGGTLSLVRTVAGRASGTFAVTPASAGAAYASGRVVRFVAPVVRVVTTATVDYYAQNETGTAQQVGHAVVTITPPPSAANPNQPPVPDAIEARAVAGQTIKIKVPTSGVDPDGDAVSVVGVGSATSLGRVLGFTASSLSYQAYPQVGNGGTDTFSYQVTDTQGASATGTVRVAVVPPGDPQPPVAVDDTITAAPGASVQVDALANDLVAPGDQVTISKLKKTNPGGVPAGASLASPTGPIVVRVGADIRHPVTVTYQLDDGLHVSNRATVTVRAQQGVNLPPLAYDQYAKPAAGATSVSVDVLHGDFDQDSTEPLTVVSPAGASATGTVSLPVTKRPQVFPYVVADRDGARATAVVYVPAVGAGVPYAKPGAQISVPANTKTTVDITKYVVDPAGKPLRTTTANTISASPSASLSAAAGTDATHLVLTAARGYIGPAAVTFNVTDGATLSTPGAATATVTVPVQIGTPTPVLRCPSTGIDVVAGGPTITLPISTLCHVWTPKPADSASLRYHLTTKSGPSGLSVGSQDTARPTVTAAGSTRTGTTGVLSVAVVGAKAVAQPLSIEVQAAPKLTIAPITIEGVKAGDHRSVNVAGYVQSPLRDAQIVVSNPTATGDIKTAVTPAGSTLTLSPASRGSGRVVVSFTVTDAANPARYVQAQLVMTVLGPPDAPTGLAAGTTVKSREVDLTWTAPDDHGAPITNYTVTYNGGSRKCGAAPSCAVIGLNNGQSYTFRVTATNAVHTSPDSAPTTATPDRVPDTVRGLTGSNPQDTTLTLTWTPDSGNFSPVLKYQLSWLAKTAGGGGGEMAVQGTARTATIRNLSNASSYSFQIRAINKQGPSLPSTTFAGDDQSAGQPATPPAPTVNVQTDTASNNDVVVLSNYKVEPNGPGPTTYTVIRTSNGSPKTLNCDSGTAPTCTDPNVQLDGTVYTYAVSARNAAPGSAHASPTGPSASVEAAGTPDPITNVNLQPTGRDDEATLTLDAPASHGKLSTITCTISGNACGRWTTTGYDTQGQHISATITGFTNGNSASVTLQDCNGSSGANHSGISCDSPVTSNPVTTFGSISQLSVAASSGSGKNANWSVTVNPNGKSVHVVVTADGSQYASFDTGVSAETRTFSDEIGYNKHVVVGATATDGTRTKNADFQQASSGPEPSISVAEGPAGTTTYCTTKGCRQIDVTMRDFAPNTSYTLYFDTDCSGINSSSCSGGTNGGKTHYQSESITTDGSGNASSTDRYFGYTGSNVWTDVTADGDYFESNHVQFT